MNFVQLSDIERNTNQPRNIFVT